jgi:hypothetical protein
MISGFYNFEHLLISTIIVKKSHPEDTSEGSAQLQRCGDSSLSL